MTFLGIRQKVVGISDEIPTNFFFPTKRYRRTGSSEIRRNRPIPTNYRRFRPSESPCFLVVETLRINLLLPLLIPREASRDLKIGGYDIPKKTWIQVNVWAIHRNPNIWKDPEVFIPERFMDKDIDYKGVNFELLPFGSGRRMCPGMNLGMALVHLTLINLLYRFDWKLPDGMDAKDVDLEESYGLVSPKKIPLELIPVITQWT
ncbi:hypothetical protein YC2023_086207 [Brassica napus]